MHTLLKVTEENKPYLIRRYTDYIVSRMDNVEILEEFKNYFYKEKVDYSPQTLESEINRYCPEILENHIVENVIGKGSEFNKNLLVKETRRV